MLDIGWSEMAVIAFVALIVLGPKELPFVLRTVGQWMRKARRLAHEFQSGLDDMVREAELEEARKHIESTKNFNIDKAVEDAIDPTGGVKEEARAIEAAARGDSSNSHRPGRADGGENADRTTPENQPEPDTSGSPKDEQREGAQIIKHPLRVAPAHSVTPPREEPVGDVDDSTQQRA